MDEHTLCELVAGLASRINNLAVASTGDDSRALLAQQDILSKLNQVAIIKALDANNQDYRAAVAALTTAKGQVDAALASPKEVASAIGLTAKAVDAAKKALA